MDEDCLSALPGRLPSLTAPEPARTGPLGLNSTSWPLSRDWKRALPLAIDSSTRSPGGVPDEPFLCQAPTTLVATMQRLQSERLRQQPSQQLHHSESKTFIFPELQLHHSVQTKGEQQQLLHQLHQELHASGEELDHPTRTQQQSTNHTSTCQSQSSERDDSGAGVLSQSSLSLSSAGRQAPSLSQRLLQAEQGLAEKDLRIEALEVCTALLAERLALAEGLAAKEHLIDPSTPCSTRSTWGSTASTNGDVFCLIPRRLRLALTRRHTTSGSSQSLGWNGNT
ncbi:unnamed protein product [Polarella glacialis]|uniref:Uncharacterized protein n=1 Tax=Polarella glacialis TaxID=89957 RepID=A0A813F4Q2_POLGL|nr:unnamed protein product [Polarella glacialis]